MTLSELSDSLCTMSRSLKTLADLVDQMQPGPEPGDRCLTAQDILSGQAKLSTLSPDYREASLILTMASGQTVEVCLTLADLLDDLDRFKHDPSESLTRRIHERQRQSRTLEGLRMDVEGGEAVVYSIRLLPRPTVKVRAGHEQAP